MNYTEISLAENELSANATVSIFQSVRSIFLLDLKLFFRKRNDFLQPLLFFILVLILFPLALGPEKPILMKIGPGIMWIAILFSILLGLQNLFREEFHEGVLNLQVLSTIPLSIIMLSKILANLVIFILPILILTPFLAQFFYLNWHAIWILLLSILIAAPSIFILGAVVSALTISLKNNGFLLALLILPLIIPILIFAAGAAIDANNGLSASQPLLLLTALLVLLFTLGPICVANGLKIGIS